MTVLQAGALVSFRIADVYIPDPADLLAQLTPGNRVLGRIVELSDRGSAPDEFAVVELRQGQTVIVARDKLTAAEGGCSPA